MRKTSERGNRKIKAEVYGMQMKMSAWAIDDTCIEESDEECYDYAYVAIDPLFVH